MILRLLPELAYPSPTGPQAVASGRAGRVNRRELWGYAVWAAMGVVIAVPEISAALSNSVPWPTISGTTGHLEYRWNVTSILAVGLIVFAAFHALGARSPRPGTRG